MAKEPESRTVYTDSPKFKVKIPDIEIEYSNIDAKDVEKKFDEVMEYLRELMLKRQEQAETKHK